MELPQVARVWVVQQFMTLWNLSHGPTFTCSGLQSKTTTQSITVLTQSHSPSPLSCLAIWIYNLTVSERPNGKSRTHMHLGTSIHSSIACHSVSIFRVQQHQGKTPVMAMSTGTDGWTKTEHVLHQRSQLCKQFLDIRRVLCFEISILQKYRCAKGYAKQAKEWDCCAKFNARATMQTTAHNGIMMLSIHVHNTQTFCRWCILYLIALVQKAPALCIPSACQITAALRLAIDSPFPRHWLPWQLKRLKRCETLL